MLLSKDDPLLHRGTVGDCFPAPPAGSVPCLVLPLLLPFSSSPHFSLTVAKMVVLVLLLQTLPPPDQGKWEMSSQEGLRMMGSELGACGGGGAL